VVQRSPPQSEAENSAERFRKHGEYDFTILRLG
jgi:hypothetical protein